MNTAQISPFFFRLRKLLRKLRPILTGIALSLYLGIIATLISVPNVSTRDILAQFYPLYRPLPFVVLFSLILLVLPSLALLFLDPYCTNRRWEVRLANLTSAKTDPSIAPYASTSVAWGGCLTLASCPDFQQGWELEKILIRHFSGAPRFTLNRVDKALYTQFRGENRDKKWYSIDDSSLRLARNPIVFSDSPDLRLDVQECRYSEVQYTNKRIATIPDRRKESIESILNGEPTFAHTFVAHILVITADQRVLATLSSNKKDYFGNMWSFSIEEQLRLDDLSVTPEKRAAHWFTRALDEELGVSKEDVNQENIRSLTVFIEGHNLNCGVCVVAQLPISQKEIASIIEVKPRTDYEFTDFKFLSLKEMAGVLRSSRGWSLHPTSEYRIYWTLIHKLGASEAAKWIFGL